MKNEDALWRREIERRLEVAERFIADRHCDLTDLTKRFNAHEMRHARELEALAKEIAARPQDKGEKI